MLDLYRDCGGGTEAGPVPARVLALDPPFAAWQGLEHYVYAVGLIRSHDWQLQQEERERKSRMNSGGSRR